MWLVATWTLANAQLTCRCTSAWRSTESAMAKRMSGDSVVFGPLAISNCKKVLDKLIWLWTWGSEVISSRNAGVMESGKATWT